MKKVAAVLAVVVLGIGEIAGAAELQTTSGTMELGGTLSLTPLVLMPKQGDNQVSYTMAISPTAGYFLMDNLELTGGFSALMFFGDNTDKLSKIVGFNVGARYFVKMGALAPYFGAALGMNFSIPKEGKTQKGFDIAAPIGIIYALNEHVGIDFGLRVNFNLDLDDPKTNSLLVPIGYLGMQAFF